MEFWESKLRKAAPLASLNESASLPFPSSAPTHIKYRQQKKRRRGGGEGIRTFGIRWKLERLGVKGGEWGAMDGEKAPLFLSSVHLTLLLTRIGWPIKKLIKQK